MEAAGELLDALDRKSFRRIGLGRIGDRHFLFHCGVGFDAAVVEAVERRAAFKRYAAHPLFVMAAFDTWLRTYDHSHGRFSVTFPDGETVPDATFLIVSKASPYTYLGHRPITVAPAATLDSPLSFTVVRARHTPSILSIAAAGVPLDEGAAPPARRRAARRRPRRDDRSDEPFPYQVDGDYLGDVRRLDVAYVPDALTLVGDRDRARRRPTRRRADRTTTGDDRRLGRCAAGVRVLARFVRLNPLPFSIAIVGAVIYAGASVLGTLVLGRVTDKVLTPAFQQRRRERLDHLDVGRAHRRSSRCCAPSAPSPAATSPARPRGSVRRGCGTRSPTTSSRCRSTSTAAPPPASCSPTPTPTCSRRPRS